MTEIKPEWVDALSVAHAEMCDEDMRESGGRYLRTMGEFYVPFLEAVAPLIAAEARRQAFEDALAICDDEESAADVAIMLHARMAKDARAATAPSPKGIDR